MFIFAFITIAFLLLVALDLVDGARDHLRKIEREHGHEHPSDDPYPHQD